MAIKVYVPGKTAPRVFAKGETFSVGEGHLGVYAPYDGNLGVSPIEALFAPGQWTFATRADGSED